MKVKIIENPYEIGDILHHSWGYDQTQCDYYQVVDKTTATVTLKPIQTETVENSEGHMSRRAMPVKNAFCTSFLGAIKKHTCEGTEVKKRVSAYQRDNGELRYYIPTEHGWCDKWDGDPKYNSWYH